MDIDLTFAHKYTLNTEAWLSPCPGLTHLYYYPGANTNGGQDGVLLEIRPANGMSWLAMFAGGPQGYLTGVYGCPNGHSLCVVSCGRCYFVRADDPQQWREKTEAIREVIILPEHNILLLRDEESLIAYGVHGFLWKTKPLSDDGFTIEGIDGNILRGKAPSTHWQNNTWVEYEVNLVTGRHKLGMENN